jgi:hypothetical protein
MSAEDRFLRMTRLLTIKRAGMEDEMKLAQVIIAMAGYADGFVLASPVPALSEGVAATHRQNADVRHHARTTIPPTAIALSPAGMVMPERARRPQSDPPNVEGYYAGGDTGFSWEPYGWSDRRE